MMEDCLKKSVILGKPDQNLAQDTIWLPHCQIRKVPPSPFSTRNGCVWRKAVVYSAGNIIEQSGRSQRILSEEALTEPVERED
jgi:hypothetical protein